MGTSTTDVAEATATPILEFGRAWMLAPGTGERASELGFGDLGRFGFWVNGRAGVLGDVDSQVAAAAIGFMAQASVRRAWEGRPAELSAWEAALGWFDCAAVWGREALGGMDLGRTQRLNGLARRVIDQADPSLGSLFAGSTLIPLPGDPAGDAAINLNVLRELRGGAHLSACHAVGLGPHATIMSTRDPVRGAAQWAEALGWPEPHPEPDFEARERIEEMTTLATARAFEVLADAERSEFVELVGEARACLAD